MAVDERKCPHGYGIQQGPCPTCDDPANVQRFVRKFPDKCCADVSRAGESQPCDKTAVAVTIDAEDGHWWPVCPHHSRGRRMLPLARLIEVLRNE